MDVPLLFESKSEDQCDDIMVIYVSETMQLDRLMARDGLNSVDAFKRMTSQMSIERKANMADFVIDNSGTIEETYQQLAAWLGIFGYQPLK
nr:dephospho-CoA kinase [Aerococcus sp. 1KP-2016]